VIHAVGGEQDMRKMGGLRRKIPWTFWTMTAGTLAIAGIPGLAGFFSKDEILWRAVSSELGFTGWVGLITAFITSFYMFRLWFMTFFGELSRRGRERRTIMQVIALTMHMEATGMAGFTRARR